MKYLCACVPAGFPMLYIGMHPSEGLAAFPGRTDGCSLLEHNVVRVRRVAHGVSASQEHLEGDVGHSLSHLHEPIPRTFLGSSVVDKAVSGRGGRCG